MKTILFYLTFFLFAGNLMSQIPMLKGRVIDKDTREPVPFANVVWCDLKAGASTDMDGAFLISDARTCDTLLVTMVGYLPVRMYVSKGMAEVTVEMKVSEAALDSVTISVSDVPLIETSSGLVDYDGELGSIRGGRATVTGESATLSFSSAKLSKGESADSYEMAPSADESYGEGGATGGISAGQLTAGEVNDFTKWELWTDINSTDLAAYNNQWKMYPDHRFVVQVTNSNNLPVQNATAVLMDEANNVVWSARTDNTGKAELWAGFFDGKSEKKYTINVIYDNKSYPIKKVDSFQNGINFIQLPVECSQEKAVDIAFMIDATGSMGDEISYLQAELSDVVARVKDSLPGNSIRLAIVFYRDLGDAYVVTHKDFTSNIPDAVKFLKSNSAGGGGDYEEAVDSALSVCVNQLSWSDNAVARILFPVLDAPPHGTNEVLASLHKNIPRAASKGIRITPLACSGVNKSTEYLLRSMALATNGTYVFLTNHSGIGNAHIEPTTDEYTVEKLNDALVRIIVSFSESPSCDKPLVENIADPDTAVMNLPVPKDSIRSTDSTAQNDNDSLKIDTVIPVQPEISWKYYPNPTAGPVTIDILNLPDTTSGFLYLTDLTGKLLVRYEVNESKMIQIDISMYPTGTYYLTFFYGKESKLCAPVVLMH